MSRRVETLERLRRLDLVFRAGEAQEAGVSWRDLYELRDRGDVLTLSRGLYQLAETGGLNHPDFVTVSRRAPGGMVCLLSALAYWELTDDIPTRVDLATAKGGTRPRIDHPPTTVHVFAAATFSLGRTWIDDEKGLGFWITDRERSIVDAYRTRHFVGYDVGSHALRSYVQDSVRAQQIPRLLKLAGQLRVGTPIREALQVLLA